jgi:hypothetical protein
LGLPLGLSFVCIDGDDLIAPELLRRLSGFDRGFPTLLSYRGFCKFDEFLPDIRILNPRVAGFGTSPAHDLSLSF